MNVTAPPQDPRFGLPSASRADILANCPSSFHLVQAMANSGLLPAAAFEDESAFGTRVHKVLEYYFTPGTPESVKGEFTPDELDFAGQCLLIAKPQISGWESQHVCEDNRKRVLVEHRAFLRDAHGNPIGSAQCDLGKIHGKHAMILDWKTGFVEVDDASHNWQMASQAACFADSFGVETVDVWVVEPRAPRARRFKSARYSIADGSLTNAIKEVGAVFRASLASINLPLQVGPWCRACAAAARCPAVQEYVLKACKAECVTDATPTHELVKLQQLKSTIERVLDDVGAQLLARILAGETIEGVALRKRTTATITDLDGLAKDVGIPTDTLALACSKLNTGMVHDYLEGAGFHEDKIDELFTAHGTTEVTRYVQSVKRKKAAPNPS